MPPSCAFSMVDEGLSLVIEEEEEERQQQEEQENDLEIEEQYDMAVTITIDEWISQGEFLEHILKDLDETHDVLYGPKAATLTPLEDMAQFQAKARAHKQKMERNQHLLGVLYTKTHYLMRQQLDFYAGLVNLQQYIQRTFRHVPVTPSMLVIIHHRFF